MVRDELLSDLLVHASEGVEFALQIALEGFTSCDDLLHDLLSLFVGDAGSKSDAIEVAANADTGALDHLGIFLGEWRAMKTFAVHLRDVMVSLLVAVVLLNEWVEELAELGVGVVRACVDTNARVNILAATENAGLE